MLTLFFVPDLGAGSTIEVLGDEAHHAIKVIRVEVGEELLLADGNGGWARGSVQSIGKKSFTLAILERGFAPEEAQELIVIQALMKSDRAKEAIELLTVGCNDDYPVAVGALYREVAGRFRGCLLYTSPSPRD